MKKPWFGAFLTMAFLYIYNFNLYQHYHLQIVLWLLN